MTISVIISTYNRCESLKDTLNSFLTQQRDNIFDYEIIIVDNNSKDKTKEVVEFYMPKFNGKLRYIFECNQGLSYSRNTGVQEAKGEIIAFTDDDVIVDQKWLFNIAKSFNDYNYDGIGGRILPIYSENVSKWVRENKDLLKGPIVMYDYGEDMQIYNRDYMRPFVGANMAYKNECFSKGDLFRIDLGVGKGVLGEDTEFFMRLAKDNKRLYYCGKALVWHKVDKKRTTLKYIAKWFSTMGRYFVREEYGKVDDGLVCYFGIPRYLFREIMQDVILLGIYIINRRKFLKTWESLFTRIGQGREYIRYNNGYK